MARDSLYGETILSTVRPARISVPDLYKLVAVVAAVVSAVTICFALVLATELGHPIGSMIVFAAWCATLALGAWRIPLVWRAGVEYVVTDKHVIWRRGRLRRSIERGSISYALIKWKGGRSNVGDLVLVRAVPTGALRRTLTLTLPDVEAPDRLWALVRGVEPCAPHADGVRPLAQRLDDGERVLWTAMPHASPWNRRRVGAACIAFLLALATVRMLARAVPSLVRVFRLHALPAPAIALLVGGVALAVLLVASVAVGVAYSAWVRPVRLLRATRYFVTDRRVLIRRGSEELSLERSRIAYVIAAPSKKRRAEGARRDGAAGAGDMGLQDVFLVLDGPRARGLAASGAFGGDDGGGLVPVFSAIEDAETVGALLQIRDAA